MQFGPLTRSLLVARKSFSHAPRSRDGFALAVAECRGVDRRRFDAGGFGIGEHVGDVRRRHDHHGMIDRLADVAQRRETAFAEDRLLPRIDEMDAAAHSRTGADC